MMNFQNLSLYSKIFYVFRFSCRHRSTLRSREPIPWDQEWPMHEENSDISESEKRRHISGLRTKYRNRLSHVMEPFKPEFESHYTKQHKMRMLGKYGSKSGYNVAYHWPSKEELKELIKVEKEWEPPLQQRLDKVLNEEKEIHLAKLEKEKAIQEGLKYMPKYIEQFKKRLAKADEIEAEALEKQKQLVDQAYDYFGYNVDHRDPRFIKMVEDKEEEDKKMRKLKKKEQRQNKLLLSMKEMIEKKSSSSE